MATLPRAVIDSYTASLNGLSAAGRRILAARLAAVRYESIADLREQVLEAMEPLCAASSDAAAAMAAQFYDSAREYETGEPLGAQAISRRSPEATEGAVRALIQMVVDGKPFEQFLAQLSDRLDFEVKRASGECVKANAARDPLKPKWARVPSGSETCGFCLMLASRGFVYSSDKAAGSDGHYHPNCDCRIIPGFDGMTVEGYDPESLYAQWKASERE